MIQGSAFVAMEWSIEGPDYLQVAVVLVSMIQGSAFVAMEWSIEGLDYLQLAVVLVSMIQDFADAAMGGYRGGVVAMENKGTLVWLLLGSH